MQLDAANQSLADALKLVFVGIQIAMLGLIGYFVFSGVQSIKETESGIRLLFGRVTGDNLPSGAHFSWPYPMGEMLRVDTGATTVELDESFMPLLSPDNKKLPIATVAQQGAKLSLKPGEDGSLITGDENIAHTRWKVLYQRTRPREFVENILPEDEKQIVKAAVERGVVQAIATVKIDDLLKQSQGDQGSAATRAREIAQQTLDAMKAGIEIKQLTLQDKFPPLPVFAEFNKVQTAEQNAGQQRAEAEATSKNLLNETAGAAYEPILQQIDAYEAAIEKGDKAEQEKVYASINSLLMGEKIVIGDRTFENAVSGRVKAMLLDADQYRKTIVGRTETEYKVFKAALAQFKSNPDVLVQREWADAMMRFLNRPVVEIYSLPTSTEIAELTINRDQDLEKAGAAARKQMAFDRVKRERERAAEEERRNPSKSPKGLQSIPQTTKASGG